MKNLTDLTNEEQEKITEAIANNDVETFKNTIGYDDMSQLEKVTWMAFYDDLSDTLRKIRNVHTSSQEAKRNSMSNEDRVTLERVSEVVTNRLKSL